MKKLILAAFLAVLHPHLYGYESDQFTVPNEELADVGVDISAFVYGKLKIGVDKINSDLKELPDLIDQAKHNLSSSEAIEKPLYARELNSKIKSYSERLEAIQTPEGVIASLYKEIGPVFSWEDQRDGVFGLPISFIPYPDNMKDGKRIKYVPKKTQNIYALAGFHRIISSTYFVFCSSLRMFGVYLGVDKLGHFFNQGYQYFKLYNKALQEGKIESEALKAAVEWGKKSENTLFGTWVDGVYSNGDLAANYAGLLFYRNLLGKVKLAGLERPAVLVVNDDKTLGFNPDAFYEEDTFLAPYISNHLNEAMNPSRFEKLQRVMVKKAIVKTCDRVKKFYEIRDQSAVKNLTQSLYSFYGEDYGHRTDDLLTLHELCF